MTFATTTHKRMACYDNTPFQFDLQWCFFAKFSGKNIFELGRNHGRLLLVPTHFPFRAGKERKKDAGAVLFKKKERLACWNETSFL